MNAELLSTLPMPLAQLLKRARMAQPGLERHHAAFYLGEATLKLAASARINRWIGTKLERGGALAKRLEALVLPSTGHWMGFLRETSKALATAERDPLGGHAALTRGGKALAKAIELCRAAAREGAIAATQANVVEKGGVLGFFDALVAYRNNEIGHGGQRPGPFYVELGDLLLAAVEEVLRVPELFGGLHLVLPRLEVVGGKSATIRLLELTGLGGSSRTSTSTDWAPGELYFVGAEDYRLPLMPLVMFAETSDQHERFGFLNGADSKDGTKIKKVEFLDYTTSRALEDTDAPTRLMELLGKLRGETVDEQALSNTMSAIAAESEARPAEAGPAGAGDPLVGRTILDRYRVVEKLGEGGMGAVYAVEHLTLGTRFAMKVLHHRLAPSRDVVRRFEREAREAAKTEHPGIVQVFDFGELEDKSFYLMMELLDGESLQQRIRRGPLPIDEVVRVGVAALDALQAAHARGVVHRDVKPDNLILPAKKGAALVKIVDFGIAKAQSDEDGITVEGAVLGTPAYIAPEQLGDMRSVDARADVYAMGGTLLACLTGRAPASGADLRSLLAHVATGDIERDPRGLRPDTPDWLAAIVTKALAFERDKRFESAAAMRDALLAGPSGSAVDLATGPTAPMPVPPVSPPPVVETESMGVSPEMPTRGDAASPGAAPTRGGLRALWLLGLLPFVGVAAFLLSRGPSAAMDSGTAQPRDSASSATSAASGAPAVASTTALPSPSAPRPEDAPAGMVRIDGGEFQLGYSAAEIAAERARCEKSGRKDCSALGDLMTRATPSRPVNVSPFYFDRTEVSATDFAAWLNELREQDGLAALEKSKPEIRNRQGRLLAIVALPGRSGPDSIVRRDETGAFVALTDGGKLPVTQVTWLGAQRYCASLGRRLPTEAEWELVARGPGRSRFASGDAEPSCDAVVYGRWRDKARWDGLSDAAQSGPCATKSRGEVDSSPEPVDTAEPLVRQGETIFGLAGNVREWVLDATVESAPGRVSFPTVCEDAMCSDPWVDSDGKKFLKGPPLAPSESGPKTLRVIRGCSFLDPVDRCLVAARGYSEGYEFDAGPNVGFRCAANVTR